MKSLVFTLFLIFYASSSWAGVCTIMIHRACQPGKPCRTSETHTALASSAADCETQGRRFCPVYFTEGVASKQVRASFEGQPLNGGNNLCQ